MLPQHRPDCNAVPIPYVVSHVVSSVEPFVTQRTLMSAWGEVLLLDVPQQRSSVVHDPGTVV